MAEALRYKDKVTIVTGGSKGIGRGCVEVFGKALSLCPLLFKLVLTKDGIASGPDLMKNG